MSNSLRPHESQHARPPCPSPTPGVHSNSRPSIRWCHPAISSSVSFSSCPQSLPASESFPMSQLFAWGGQSTGVSALASFLPKNTQGWSPSDFTGWISLQSKGLSRVFSNTTVQKHQFFGTQLLLGAANYFHVMSFPGGPVIKTKNPPANAGDMGSIPGLGRCPGGGNGNPLKKSCLEKFHGQRNLAGYSSWVAKSQTWLSDWLSMHACNHLHGWWEDWVNAASD